MTDRSVDDLIDALAGDARPVEPLAPPFRRAATMLALFAVTGAVVIAASDRGALTTRYAGREAWVAAEMLVLLAAGLLAVTGAFFASVPGRSRYWGRAALSFFVAWLLLSGAGCVADGASRAADAPHGNSLHCMLFITGVSVALSLPLVWRLSRVAALEPFKVALLAGLGIASLSALLLHFYHPFDITPFDLAVHWTTIMLVTATMILLRRRMFRPA